MPAYEPPNNAFYTQVSLPCYINPGAFIGKDGCHLKRMTELSGCDYLWYDFKRGVIEVWGKEYRLAKACRMLNKRIMNFKIDEEPIEPPEFQSDLVNISQEWASDTTTYTLEGAENDCIKFYLENILTRYPSAEYNTNIVKKEPRKIVITRIRCLD